VQHIAIVERSDSPGRLAGLTGLGALFLGAAGGVLERGWPSADRPTAVAEFIATNRAAILAQSMVFMLSAAMYLWFLAGLREHLLRTERRDSTFASVAFAGGCLWAGMSMVAQALQVGLSIAPSPGIPPAMYWTMAAMFGIANLPLAMMLIAVAAASFRHAAFPRWLGCIAALAAASQLLLWFGTVVRTGPLAPNGWLTYVLYPVFAGWLVPTSIVILRQRGRSAGGGSTIPRIAAYEMGGGSAAVARQL
jgi:hypothetical protein